MSLVETNREGDVDVIRLARPDRLNALSSELVDELIFALREAETSTSSVLLIGGHGRGFCAGADMAELGTDAVRGRAFLGRVAEVLGILRYFGKPVVAAVQGYAVGGGAEIALEADVRLMSPDALIRFPDVAIGSTPASTYRLVRTVGPSIAARMVLLQEDLGAQRAHVLGVCLKVVDAEDLWREALDVAQVMSRLSALSLRLGKQSLAVADSMDGRTDLAVNLESMMQCFESSAQQNAVGEFFARRD